LNNAKLFCCEIWQIGKSNFSHFSLYFAVAQQAARALDQLINWFSDLKINFRTNINFLIVARAFHISTLSYLSLEIFKYYDTKHFLTQMCI